MIALISGTGALPGAIVDALDAQGRDLILCELAGNPIEGAGGKPVLRFRIETLGHLLQQLTTKGVNQVCFAGAIARPQIDPALIDVATQPLVPRIMAAIGKRDDGALREVMAIFETAGFAIRAAHQLAPDLLPAQGILTHVQPRLDHINDIAVAYSALKSMSLADVGQACVVAGGKIIATEPQQGTDFMLEHLGSEQARGGMLFKAPKNAQDRRTDLPVIGPQTVALATKAGLGCITIEAGGVMVLERPHVISMANATGLALWVREPGL